MRHSTNITHAHAHKLIVRHIVYYFSAVRYGCRPGLMAVLPPHRLSHSHAEAIVIKTPSMLRSLLQSSRIVRNEILPIFWQCTTFVLSCTFFGPKIGRLGDRTFNNVRSVCINETITGDMALGDIEESICLFRSLPLLYFFELGLGYRHTIQPILWPEAGRMVPEALPCAIHTRNTEECKLLKSLLRSFANSEGSRLDFGYARLVAST